ncbi:hypothetical protein CDEST_02190 [Colletotrichum destructivum]|uniref:DUF6604 domain-containing protein n=1 Tax=Colletotrichum destructivum TaxID=34406 RepID=A0AAX4I1U9_9PEZI|nr:hypothetical protein CDEST_02190 [Colletotrichum destructivum]
MMPSVLSSTYQQYKRDTNVVASWLATTATSSGYTKPLSQPVTTAASSKPVSQRLKGKARKEAKKHQVFGEAAPVQDIKPMHVISIKDFVPLADFISAKLSGPFKVPDFFVSALNRVIETRKRFSSMLGSVRGFKDYHGDKKHVYFVTVLERVRDAFKPHADADAFNMSSMVDATDSIKKKGPKNMFAVLDVYEPSQSFLAAPDIDRPAQPPTEYVAENDDSATEALFIYTAFLRDLGQLRDQILELWGEYKSGDVDLAAVSVATNTALQLARNMEQEIAPSMEKLEGALGAIHMFYEAACAARGLDPLEKESFGDDFNYQCYQEGSDFYYNTFSLLNSFNSNSVTDPGIPTYNGKFGWYDDTKQARNGRERWQEDKAALLEVFADQTMLVQLLKAVPVHDEFTKGLKTMLETSKIPVWLCFAAQVYLDVLKFLGASVRNGERDLQRSTRVIADSVNNALQIRSDRETTVKQNMQECRRLATMWGRGQDPFSAIRIASGLQDRPSNFLEHHPIYCGLYLHFVRSLFHRVGVEYAAKPGNVMHGIQLYQAVQQEGLLQGSEKYSLLEAMLESQGNSTFFVGDPPKSPEAYFKNFGLSKGVSAAQWLQTRDNPKRVTTSKAGIRIMKFKGICSLSLAARIAIESDQRGLNAEVIDQILERSGWLENLPATTESRPDDPQKKVMSHRALSTSELVRQVCFAINDEISEISFDYYHVDRVCWELLKHLRESVDAQNVGGSLDPSLLRTILDNNLGDVVGIVFAAAVGQIPTVPPADSMAPLRKAADAFEVKFTPAQ